MIWHIFRKDLKLLWPLVLIVAAVQVLNAVLWLVLGNFGEPESLGRIASLFIIAVLLGIGALIVTVVHQDTVPGDRQDWLVRPIRRRDLLLEKLLFVLATVHGPILLVDLVHCMATGFTFGVSLSAALSRNIYLLIFFSLPILALAAMTSTIIEVIGSVLAACLLAVVFMISIQAVTNVPAGLTFPTMSNAFLMLEFWQAVLLVAAVIIIPLQYFRRATVRARALALGAVLILIPISASIPWTSAFAFLQWLSPDPAAAKAVTVAFDPALGKKTLKPGSAARANSVWLPLHVSGLAPDSIVLKDRAYIRIIGQDGATLFQGLSIGDPQTTGNSSASAVDDFPARTTTAGDVRTYQLFSLPWKIYELVRNQPVRLHVDYALTLFHVNASDTIPALDGDQQIVRFGRCKTKIDDEGDDVEIGCLTAGNPSNCATLVLENTVSGQHNPPFNFCSKSYLPYNAHFSPNAMLHAGLDLPFRDLQGLAKYPVDSTQLANARVLFKAYEPVAHFTRRLIIPEIRLGDWEANVEGASP